MLNKVLKNEYRMKKLLFSLSVLLTFAFSGFAQETTRNWQPFTPANGDFTILAPGTMHPDDYAAEGSKKKGSYGYKDKTGFFAVLYQKMPHAPKKPDKYFNKNRDNAVKGVNGRLISENDFSSNGFKGREIFVQMDYGRVERARMFFHGKRLYVVLAIVPSTEVNSDAINKYMGSFTAKTPVD